MTAQDVLALIQNAGGTVVAEGNTLKCRAPEPLPAEVMALAKEHKPELLSMLSGRNHDDDLTRLSLSQLEGLHVALKIESDEYGDLWLVSTEAERASQ